MTKQEKIRKYDLKLQKYIDNKSFVKICRTICGEDENISGFILNMSEDFLLLQLTNDFMFDGFAIIRKDDFDSIRHSSFERTQRKIFNSEGLLKSEYGFDKKMALKNWSDIFSTLKEYDFHIIVENINVDYLDFWIGEITRVTTKSLHILNYNPDGIFDVEPTSIKYNTISIVKFGDRYSTTFRKYLRQKEASANYKVKRVHTNTA